MAPIRVLGSDLHGGGRRDQKEYAVGIIAAAALFLFTAGAPNTGSFTLFGPEPHHRTTGAPNTFTNTFSASGTTGQYVMRVTSSGASSGTISLNGIPVFGPSDFNAQTGTIQKPVTLLAVNQITVVLAGK